MIDLQIQAIKLIMKSGHSRDVSLSIKGSADVADEWVKGSIDIINFGSVGADVDLSCKSVGHVCCDCLESKGSIDALNRSSVGIVVNLSSKDFINLVIVCLEIEGFLVWCLESLISSLSVEECAVYYSHIAFECSDSVL